jgi:hypothetical protein
MTSWLTAWIFGFGHRLTIEASLLMNHLIEGSILHARVGSVRRQLDKSDCSAWWLCPPAAVVRLAHVLTPASVIVQTPSES